MLIQSKFKFVRLTAGLTQKEVADIMGVPDSAISLYEAGSLEPNRADMIKFSNATGWKVEYFYPMPELEAYSAPKVYGRKH